MNRILRNTFKIIAFVFVFFILTWIVAFFCKDDANSYARVLFHEFYEQEKIDYLICGASHVSHGVEANRASDSFGKAVFNIGTPSQQIDGTLAILRQAVKSYRIEKVFLELDFAIATDRPVSERNGFKAEYIVAGGLKDKAIKADYLLHCSRPIYYLNSFLPIGKDKMMTLNPKKVGKKLRSLLNGDYFKYQYGDEDSEYAGKGCVLDVGEIADGTFSNYYREGMIDLSGISDDWKNTVDKIIALCRENGIELIFYSMPGSDFYLNERGNYDEYYAFCRDFCAERGFRYYDFNLARPELCALSDSDYHDDNHLSKKGVYRWTEIFCDFFSEKYTEADALGTYFYASYAEKMATQSDRIFGLYLIQSDDRTTLEITPLSNHVSPSRITYDVYAIFGGEETLLARNSINTSAALPSGKSGKIRVVSYIDGIKQNDCTERFASF